MRERPKLSNRQADEAEVDDSESYPQGAFGTIKGTSGDPWLVRAEVDGGPAEDARLPLHVDRSWLSAALAVAPVEASFQRHSGILYVTAIYPGPAHADVRAELHLEGSSVTLRAGKAIVDLSEDQVRIRGTEIESRATGEHWVMGARIRFN